MRNDKQRFTVWRCRRCGERFDMQYQLGVWQRTHYCDDVTAPRNEPLNAADNFEVGIATIYYHYAV